MLAPGIGSPGSAGERGQLLNADQDQLGLHVVGHRQRTHRHGAKAVSRLMAGQPTDHGSTTVNGNHDFDDGRVYCHFSSMCSTSTHVRLTEWSSKGRAMTSLQTADGWSAGNFPTRPDAERGQEWPHAALCRLSGCRGPILNHSLVIRGCAALRPVLGGRVGRSGPFPAAQRTIARAQPDPLSADDLGFSLGGDV